MGDLVVEKVVTPGAAEPPGATWSNCLVIGDEIVVSGQHARGPDGAPIGGDDLYLQARASLAKIADLLAAAGGGLHNVYKLVIYVTDADNKAAVNRARSEVFGPVFPCSTLVGVGGFAFPGLLIEIDAFANRRVDLRLA